MDSRQPRFPHRTDLLAAAFFFAHDLLRPPSPQQWAFLTSSRTRRLWLALAASSSLPDALELPLDLAEFESEYRTYFQAGEPLPLIPLSESHYNKTGSRTDIAEANIRFYSAFGLLPPEEELEAADHLSRQLEFAGYLFRREAELRAGAVDAERAQGTQGAEGAEEAEKIAVVRREFLRRHMLNWLPEAARRARQAPAAWVASFLTLVEELTRAAAEQEVAES